MKVLHLINTLSVGGAELHLLTLCKSLKENGVDVAVACLRERVRGSRPLRKDFEAQGIPVYDLGTAGRYDFRFLYKVPRLVNAFRPDVLHSHLPRGDLGAAICSWSCPNVIWVSSIHRNYGQNWSAAWAFPLLRLSWRRADHLVAISYALEDWLAQATRVLASRISVVHYGIEADKFLGARPRTTGLNGDRDGAVIGSIGRIEPAKRHEALIRVMPRVLREFPSASLLIAGHDPTGHSRVLEDLIDELGVRDSVRLVGFKDDIPAFLDTLDVFAFASASEGFGQVIIEAMASARPVVAMRIPPITEIVEDGKTGLLVEPTDSRALAERLVRLLRNRELASAMGLSGRERVLEYFSAQRMVEDMLDLYESLDTRKHS